jgi:glycosyltransferase involved in cell wall biosynthesis
LRILFLADIRFPLERANGIQTMETCHALARRGHEVVLAVRPDTSVPARDPFAFYGLSSDVPLRIESARPGRWVGRPRGLHHESGRPEGPRGPEGLHRAARRIGYLWFACRRALGRPRADVILTRDLTVADLLLRLPRRVRSPVVYESHGFAPAVSGEMPDLLHDGARGSEAKQHRLGAREARVWRRADAYVTITKELARELEASFGRRAGLAAIPDGARIGPDRRFSPPRATDSPVVGYAGHFYPWKGVDVLLAAIARTAGARGLLVGGHPGEPDFEKMRRLADSLGIGHLVRFTGLVPPADVRAALESADVLVVPNAETSLSARYTSPLKLFEYMAVGKPIVASDLPALREVLEDGLNAVLVQPGDADALAAGIRRVTSDPALATRLARQAFADAEAYGWDRRAERLERLLEAARSCRPDGHHGV